MFTEIRRIVVVGLFTFLFGWNIGYPLEVVLCGIGAYILWTFRIIGQLFNWIDKGMRGIPPETDGVWGEISDTLSRQRRRHRRTQEKMRKTISRISRLTEALDEGILVLRSDLTIDWWNSSATNLLGLRASDRGSAVINLIRDPAFVEYIHRDEFIGSIDLPSIIQSDRLLKLSASGFGDNEIALVITDITKLKNLEQLRKEFVGNISHELRTPLTVMRGYIETLQDLPNNTATVETAFDQMSEQITRMQALADDLIMISRLEADNREPVLEAVNISDLLRDIVSEAQALSDGKHSITLDCKEQTLVQAEASDIRSALSNIVFNAVRHNPDGASIAILVSDYQDFIDVSIRDDGVGIDPMEIPRLTERFYRGDSSRSAVTGGTGLGLAIVKHSINRYGGHLVINSRLGHGAEFICRLPKQSR
ncbi:MAG: phosphate regulon sensor histidine kinase PhoR [Porticoccaceae bacterium]|nr:phosphate regulon sensor histidine kinase PhoR [Porticoccaceae bacterium]MDG1306516.1 phosphate regulon sensor histidine kinase PhoR [Porticoccaceae bacterium]